MNTAALKRFAPAVRRDLMEAVERKLDVALAAQAPDYRTTFAAQVAELRELARADRAGLVERVAYTWFNRLTALRYLDARRWHPFHARVLTPASAEETQPELLKLTRTGALPEELRHHVDQTRLDDLLDGRIPSANPQGEVYRHLVLAACRFYHALLPDLFERVDDATELLLPDDLLTEHSVAHGFRTEITDADCETVEVLGWLYQFYIAEKKDAVMARKSAVPSEDIPAVTQLFTPHWIVRYLVENSLGRLWLLNRPESRLREHMPYYLEGEPETDFLRIERPEEIRLIDPAVGSGHMLVYAFDLLYAIYEEAGYAPTEIAGLILRHNLHGVDIDPRAAQLAMLALVLKARERSRRFFQPEALVRPWVIALQDVRFDEGELPEYVRAIDLGPLFDGPVLELLRQFEQATTFGSLIQPVLDARDIGRLRDTIREKDVGGHLLLSTTHEKVLAVLSQAQYLTARYHVTVANPPYMGSKGMPVSLRGFVSTCYAEGSPDLMTAFMSRGRTLLLDNGILGIVTLDGWMFLSSFAEFRASLLREYRIATLVHVGWNCFPEGHTYNRGVACTLGNSRIGTEKGHYLNLSDVPAIVGKEALFIERLASRSSLYEVDQEQFKRLPGTIIGFGLSDGLKRAFEVGVPLGDLASPRQGLATGENTRFLRMWHEVAVGNVGFRIQSREEAASCGKRWFPYNKGGEFRRWYGNQTFVIDWAKDGERIRSFRDEKGNPRSVIRNADKYFAPCVSWSKVTSSLPAFRYFPAGFIFDVAGTSIFAESEQRLVALLSLTNSVVTTRLLEILSPTLNLEVGHVKSLPVVQGVVAAPTTVIDRAGALIAIAHDDWNSVETSWEFLSSPLLGFATEQATLQSSIERLAQHRSAAITRMRELETKNNQYWASEYGLQDEVDSDVCEDAVTLRRSDRKRDVLELLSYIVGCMMGRYSLDTPGLILADAGDTVENYLRKVGKPLDELTFAPDADGIVPVLDGEWFEDDVVARTREFLRAAFGEATLRESFRWLEESLGKDLRKYFTSDFYRDHLQTYKKRPIYWMVQSPRKGFAALVYLHRYTRDTMNVLLNRYLREYEAKLAHRIAQLERQLATDALPTRERTAARKELEKLGRVLRECQEWERDTVLPLAQQRIALDLDDGVRVNYTKLPGALAPIPGLAAADD